MGRSNGFPRRSVRSKSGWYKTAPVANWEASTYRMNCRSGSGGTITGSEVTNPMSFLTASSHTWSHVNSLPFPNKSVRGLAIFDVNAEVVHFCLEELTFHWFQVQRVLLQYVKEHMTYFRVEVLLVEGGHDDYVIHVMPKQARVPGIDWAEDFVTHPCECG